MKPSAGEYPGAPQPAGREGTSPKWYFSWVIREVAFDRRKYGPELLIDVGWVHDLFAPGTEAHRLDFYDVLLVTRGQGTFQLDDRVHEVLPGRLFFTTPGQLRRWSVTALDGLCLFFTAEFVAAFHSDPFFLRRLAFFHRAGADTALDLPARAAASTRRRLERMAREIRRLRGDSPELLRAMLHEELLTLQREWTAARGVTSVVTLSPLVERFLDAVERRYRKEERVGAYARALGLTPGHLTASTLTSLGAGAKAIISERRLLEAKRLLWYSDRTTAEISRDLGFQDPSYFSRFFRKTAGTTPREFRRKGAR